MSVRMSCRMKTAMIGPTMPPRPPARLTPPRTTAATLGSVYGPGIGVADAGARVERQAAHRGEQPGERVGRDLRPPDRDAAPERREPVAADRVDRQAEARAAERDPDHGHDDASTTIAFGIHVDCRPARARARAATRGAAARGVEHEQREARPHEDIASVTTMSGTRVTTMSEPLIGPEEQPEHEDAGDDERGRRLGPGPASGGGDHAGQRHHRGDREVDPARDHDDGLADRRERERQDGDREPWRPATP